MNKYLGRIGLRLLVVVMAYSLVVSPAAGGILNTSDGTPAPGSPASVGGVDGAVVVDVTGARAIIDWTTIDTESGEVLKFMGADGFAVLNRVSGGRNGLGDGTLFEGNLQGFGGNIIIVNENGLVFGPDSLIQAWKFTASTLAMDATKFGLGEYEFNADLSKAGEIQNEGTIHVDNQAALLAQRVINKGTIICGDGAILLATGDKIILGSEGSDVVVEITGVSPRPGNPMMELGDVINEGSLGSTDGDIILAAGDTFAQALSPVGVGRVEHSGAISAAGDLSIAAVEEVVFEPSGTTSVDGAVGVKAATGVTVKSELASGADMTILSGGLVTTLNGFDLDSGGNMTVRSGNANAISLGDGGGAKSDGDMVLESGSYIAVDGDLESGGNMTVATSTGTFSSGDLTAGGDINLNTNLELFGGEWVADGAGVYKVQPQRIDAEDGTVTANGWISKVTAGELHINGGSEGLAVDLKYDGPYSAVTTGGNMYISGKGDIQVSGDLDATARSFVTSPNVAADADVEWPNNIGGVSVISEQGRIYTEGSDSLDVGVFGYSNDIGAGWHEVVEGPSGVDLPYKDDEGNPLGKAAIVLQSRETLKLGDQSILVGTGYYLASTGDDSQSNGNPFPVTPVDDRPGVDFLAEDAAIGGHDRDQGIASDVGIYAGSTNGNVIVDGPVYLLEGEPEMAYDFLEGLIEYYYEEPWYGIPTVVFDARNTVMMDGFAQNLADMYVDYLQHSYPEGTYMPRFRLEVCSRITEWLNQAVTHGRLPYAGDVDTIEVLEMWLGDEYVLRGAGNFPDHRAWVLEDMPPQNAVAALWKDEFPELKGCPLQLDAVAAELGITSDELQMSIGSSLAMNPNLQACDVCSRMVSAATILRDFDGAYLSAMNQVFNQQAPANAPFTPETAASIVVAFTDMAGQDADYALAAVYVDAFVEYVAVIEELGSPVGDSVGYMMAKHGKALTDNPNQNVSAYIAMRLEEIGS
jgi:filamentous hemagglutinin family protein